MQKDVLVWLQCMFKILHPGDGKHCVISAPRHMAVRGRNPTCIHGRLTRRTRARFSCSGQRRFQLKYENVIYKCRVELNDRERRTARARLGFPRNCQVLNILDVPVFRRSPDHKVSLDIQTR